jgi:hypothetical protein
MPFNQNNFDNIYFSDKHLGGKHFDKTMFGQHSCDLAIWLKNDWSKGVFLASCLSAKCFLTKRPRPRLRFFVAPHTGTLGGQQVK